MEMRCKKLQPWLTDVTVDQIDQRPHGALWPPRVVLLIGSPGGGQDIADQRGREGEGQIGANPPVAPRHRAETMRQPLRDPPLHPARRDRDDLSLDRIRQRIREDPAQGVNE